MAVLSSEHYVIPDVDDDSLTGLALLAQERDLPIGEALNEALDGYLGKAKKGETEALVEAGVVEPPKAAPKKKKAAKK